MILCPYKWSYLGLALQEGFEPTTLRLTAGCSTAKLLMKKINGKAEGDSSLRSE